MGVFDILKKNRTVEEVKIQELYAPIMGKYIPLSQIQDAVFSQGILGEGCGIIPNEGRLYAPADGEVSMVASTNHAIGITTVTGVELLVHVGMDTVEMEGNGFVVKTSVGKKIKKGDLLLCFDLQKIEMAGYPTETAFVVTDKGTFSELSLNVDSNYKVGESVGKLVK